MEASQNEVRRSLGLYYTPTDIAVTLTAWALRSNAGPVLDPSYGTCRFLVEAVSVLAAAGVAHPQREVFGVDVDASATAEATGVLLARGARPDQFLHRNFLEVDPEPRFAAVLGNPPYVRHHWQDETVKGAISDAMRDAGIALSRRASLWAPFIIHADRFVRRDGRLAMLLPGAAIQASYAAAVWDHLARQYRTVTLIRIGERAFQDALEETIVVLADGRRGRGTRAPLTVEVAGFASLAQELNEAPSVEHLRKRGRRLGRTRSDLTTRRLLDIADRHDASCRLGDIAEIRIGTVTGANRFFVRPADDDLVRHLPASEVVRIVPGSRAMTGTVWTNEDDSVCARDGCRCRLLRLRPQRRLEGKLAVEMAEAKKARVHKRSHCSRRDPWWAIQPRNPPDGFLAYMAGVAKGIVINEASVGCINGVHRVTWTAPNGEAYVLSTWTSLWALAVEQIARHYAGGVLKLEPGRAPGIPVVKHDDPAALIRLDDILRIEGIGMARQYADEVVLRGTLGFSEAQVDALRTSVEQLERRRSPRMRSTETDST
jgi:hypothetical protein